MPALSALCIKAHRTHIDALQNNASLRAAARALRDSPSKQQAWIDIFGAFRTHEFNAGIVHIFKRCLQRLGWKWTSPFVLETDWTWQVNLLTTPLVTLAHLVRDATRRAWLATINKNRPDMFGLGQHKAGPDYDATCQLLRAKGKGKLDSLDRVFL